MLDHRNKLDLMFTEMTAY